MGRTFRGLLIAIALFAAGAAGFAIWLAMPATPPKAPELGSLRGSVEQGRYLATIANCVSCHTGEDGTPYAGGHAFHTDFGIIYSTNITSDPEAGIGGWSFEQFYDAMRFGLRDDGAHLYPAFPYTAFTKLSDDDIASLFLFLREVAPSAAKAPENELAFPFNQRALMKAWNVLFLDTNRDMYAADSSSPVDRGRYVVDALGHCSACHTPRNLFGAERQDLALSGGAIIDEVMPGKYRRWSSVNLTPAKTGLGPWSKTDLMQYLKTGENGKAIVHGPMNEVVMNSTRFLSDRDLDAVASYLQSLPARERRSGRRPDPDDLKRDEVAYTVHCGSCHLPTGIGDVGLGISLAGNAVVQAPDPASLINVILYAPHLAPPPFVLERTRMKPFGKRLPASEIARITSYLRASFGNDAGEVSVEQVNAQR